MASLRVPIRPQVGVFGVFEAVDYKAWYALAEFIDNAVQSALDARASGALPQPHEPLQVDIDVTSGYGGVVAVRDNAGGIPLDRFRTAFEVGSPPPDTSGLSVYGIGMKSASAWFANRVRITTTVYGEPVRRIVEYDFPKIISNGTQELEVVQQTASAESHGTDVLLTELKNPINTKTHSKVRDHLTSIYRNYIRDGRLVLTYQGDVLAYQDPEVLTASFCKTPGQTALTWRKDLDI